MAFDSNQMLELQHIARDRYQRNGGGGTHKVYQTSKAYYDARGHNELPTWQKLMTEALIRYRQKCQLIEEHYRMAILTSQDGFYHGEDIPF
jgi:hypothetical protein